MHARVERLVGGRTLVVRPATPDDVDAVVRLYADLGVDDRYRRFFCGSQPPRSVIERWVARTGDAGTMLVVEVREPDGSAAVVAEATWTATRDGSGEFGLTVARAWRGWLGPYLLDALVQDAARQGVPSLQADVLVDNRQMLAVVRARGCVVLDSGDWSTLRVMISTSRGVPSWPPLDPRPRVLVEVAGGRWWGAGAAADAGLRVIACPGPSRSPAGWCPALRGEPCPLVAGADVVVHALHADDERSAAVLAAHRARDVTVLTDVPLQAAAAVDAVVARLPA